MNTEDNFNEMFDSASSVMDEMLDLNNKGINKSINKSLTNRQKQDLANIIVETLEIVNEEQKDDMIGDWGLFFGKYLTWKCAEDILERVIKHGRRPDFKNINECRDNFKTNFEERTNGSISRVHNIKRALRESGKSDNWMEGFDFRVKRLVLPNFSFRIKGNNTINYGQDYYILDYGNEVIRKESIKKKTAKELRAEKELLIDRGQSLDEVDEYKVTRNIELFFGTIDSISILRSVIGENDSSLFEVVYTPNNEIHKKIKGKDFSEIAQTIGKNDAGAQDFKTALMKIKSYFKKTGITETKCDVPCPGIFKNPVTGELIRSRGEGVVDINYEKPSSSEVKEALELLKKFHDDYNGSEENFVGVFRWFILSPFSYIFKTESMNPIKSLFLYGESDTAKTSLARIGMLMWSPIDSTNNTGGDNISSAWRFANVMEKNGYGVIVDECESFCEDKSRILMPIFKKGWEEEISRETNKDIQYAYGNILFTSNVSYPEDGAFYKRCDLYNFPSEYRQTDANKKKFSQDYNFINKNNNEFAKKLPAIGDYITFFVWSNPDFLENNKDETHDEIRNKLIEELITYANVSEEDYGWFLNSVKSEKDIEDGDLSLLEALRAMIFEKTERIDFHNIDNKMDSYFKDTTNEDDYYPNFSKNQQVEYLMHIDAYDYLHYDNEKEKVGISKEVKQALTKYSNGKFNDTPKIIAGKFGSVANNETRWKRETLNGSRRWYIVFTKDEFDKFLRGEWKEEENEINNENED